MELRKLIAFGKSTFSITVPKPWVIQHGLKKGDLIGIERLSSGDLQLTSRTGQRIEQREITLDATGKRVEEIRREIISAYIKDYSTIIVEGELEGKLQEIREAIHTLIGLEVMEAKRDRIISRTFLDTKNVSLDQTLRRIHYILKASAQELEQIIKTSKGEAIEINERDQEINRQTFYMIKLIVRSLRQPAFASGLGITPINGVFLWHIAECLEKIADRIKDIARLYAEEEVFKLMSEVAKAELLEIHKRTIGLTDQAMANYFKPSTAEITRIFRTSLEIRREINRFARTYMVRYIPVIMGFYRDIVLLTRSVAERRLDME